MDLAPAARLLAPRRNARPHSDRRAARAPLEQWEAILRAALPAGVMLAPQGARTKRTGGCWPRSAGICGS